MEVAGDFDWTHSFPRAYEGTIKMLVLGNATKDTKPTIATAAKREGLDTKCMRKSEPY